MFSHKTLKKAVAACAAAATLALGGIAVASAAAEPFDTTQSPLKPLTHDVDKTDNGNYVSFLDAYNAGASQRNDGGYDDHITINEHTKHKYYVSHVFEQVLVDTGIAINVFDYDTGNVIPCNDISIAQNPYTDYKTLVPSKNDSQSCTTKFELGHMADKYTDFTVKITGEDQPIAKITNTPREQPDGNAYTMFYFWADKSDKLLERSIIKTDGTDADFYRPVLAFWRIGSGSIPDHLNVNFYRDALDTKPIPMVFNEKLGAFNDGGSLGDDFADVRNDFHYYMPDDKYNYIFHQATTGAHFALGSNPRYSVLQRNGFPNGLFKKDHITSAALYVDHNDDVDAPPLRSKLFTSGNKLYGHAIFLNDANPGDTEEKTLLESHAHSVLPSMLSFAFVSGNDCSGRSTPGKQTAIAGSYGQEFTMNSVTTPTSHLKMQVSLAQPDVLNPYYDQYYVGMTANNHGGYEPNVAAQSDELTVKPPTLSSEKQTVSKNATLQATDGVTNLPDACAYKATVTQPADTSRAGETSQTDNIHFIDGSEQNVSVPVTVTGDESDNYSDSNITTVTVSRGGTVHDKDGLGSLPSDATVHVDTPADTSNVGKTKQVVTIHFGDGSSKQVTVPVTVQGNDSDNSNITTSDVTVHKGDTVDKTAGLSGVPQDATISVDTAADTSKAGSTQQTVTVHFKDGSTKQYTVNITVKDKISASMITPVPSYDTKANVSTVTVIQNGTLKPTDGLKNIPDGANVTMVTPADTSKVGDAKQVVKMTFKDGSSMLITVPVVVKPAVVYKPKVTPVQSTDYCATDPTRALYDETGYSIVPLTQENIDDYGPDIKLVKLDTLKNYDLSKTVFVYDVKALSEPQLSINSEATIDLRNQGQESALVNVRFVNYPDNLNSLTIGNHINYAPSSDPLPESLKSLSMDSTVLRELPKHLTRYDYEETGAKYGSSNFDGRWENTGIHQCYSVPNFDNLSVKQSDGMSTIFSYVLGVKNGVKAPDLHIQNVVPMSTDVFDINNVNLVNGPLYFTNFNGLNSVIESYGNDHQSTLWNLPTPLHITINSAQAVKKQLTNYLGKEPSDSDVHDNTQCNDGDNSLTLLGATYNYDDIRSVNIDNSLFKTCDSTTPYQGLDKSFSRADQKYFLYTWKEDNGQYHAWGRVNNKTITQDDYPMIDTSGIIRESPNQPATINVNAGALNPTDLYKEDPAVKYDKTITVTPTINPQDEQWKQLSPRFSIDGDVPNASIDPATGVITYTNDSTTNGTISIPVKIELKGSDGTYEHGAVISKATGIVPDMKLPVAVIHVGKRNPLTVGMFTAYKGDTVPNTAGLSGYPDGTKITVKTPADTSKTGSTQQVVTIAFPNGETREATVNIMVKDKQVWVPIVPVATINTQDVTVHKGDTVKPDSGIINLPEGAKVVVVTPADTSKPGKTKQTVKVTFKDGSSRTVSVNITVLDKQAWATITPVPSGVTTTTVNVHRGDTLKPTDGLTGLPEGAKVTVVTPADTSKVGKTQQVVKVTFKDGSSRTVSVPVNISDKTPWASISAVPSVTVSGVDVYKGNAVKPADGLKNLPDGTKVTVITPADTSHVGKTKQTVRVTFKDGSNRTVTVPVTVLDKQNWANITAIPGVTVKIVTVYKNDTVKPSEGLEGLPEGAKATVVTPADTSKAGNTKQTVKVMFKDGSSRTVTVPVIVKDRVAYTAITPIPNVNVKTLTVHVGDTVKPVDGLVGLPENAHVTVVTHADTSKAGKTEQIVKVTFKDGSSRTVIVPVVVKDKVKPVVKVEPQPALAITGVNTALIATLATMLAMLGVALTAGVIKRR